MLVASYGPDGQQQWVVEKWKSRPKKVRGIPTFPPSRRRLRLDYFLTPQTTLQFSTPLLTQTLQSRQGDTMWVGSTNTRFRLRFGAFDSLRPDSSRWTVSNSS